MTVVEFADNIFQLNDGTLKPWVRRPALATAH